VIREDSTGGVWFRGDQPGTHVGCLAIPEVSQVGVELDRKLIVLPYALGTDVPEGLLQN
jgi:hypothetical protein